jgi:YHS domain-containing protein
MILRFVFWVLAVIGFMWFLRRLQGAALQQRRATTGGKAAESMVRDRICQTFLPEADALKVDKAGKTHFFCSTTCRDRFLEGQGHS